MTPKEFIELWIADLESGKSIQGKGYLHKVVKGRDEFCCLGRACVLFNDNVYNLRINKFEREEQHGNGYETVVSYGDDLANGYLPDEVGEFLSGIVPDKDGDINIPGAILDVVAKTIDKMWGTESKGGLTVLNDSGWTFPEIAMVLRAWLETKGEQQ